MNCGLRHFWNDVIWWSYDGKHLAFGGTSDLCCHFKHVSLKQSRFYYCQMSTAHRQGIKVDGSVATISIKNFPIGLRVMYLSFPGTPRTPETSCPFLTAASMGQHCSLSFISSILYVVTEWLKTSKTTSINMWPTNYQRLNCPAIHSFIKLVQWKSYFT